MSSTNYPAMLHSITQTLSSENSLRGVFHQHSYGGDAVPSGRAISEVVELCRAVLFPSYFGSPKISSAAVGYHIGVKLERLFYVLSTQIEAALGFAASSEESDPRILGLSCAECSDTSGCVFDTMKSRIDAVHNAACAGFIAVAAAEAVKASAVSEKENDFMSVPFASAVNASSVADAEIASVSGFREDNVSVFRELSAKIAAQFIESLPELRSRLSRDAKAAFMGDPAAGSLGEVICCYPGVRAVINHRIAHRLCELKVPLLPRIISEMAHSETGIDIHPGARIGDCFSIDHGTGVVIGETCIIGNNVKLFQGVTLGAKTIPVDEKGVPLKIDRHPIIEDDVVVYANATILGRITIGKGSVIGGNVWITEDVMPGSKVVQGKAPHK